MKKSRLITLILPWVITGTGGYLFYRALGSGGTAGAKIRHFLFHWKWYDLNLHIRTARMLPEGSWNRLRMGGFSDAELDNILGKIRGIRDWHSIWLDKGLQELYEAEHTSDEAKRAERFLRAAASFHFSRIYSLLTLEQIQKVNWLVQSTFRRASRWLKPAPRFWTARISSTSHVQGYYMTPSPTPKGMIVLCNGLNFRQEEMYFYAQKFVESGFSTVCYDDPVPSTFWEVGPTLLDQGRILNAILKRIHKIDPITKNLPIGLWGVSLGAWKALRMSACSKRIRACIALSPFYEMESFWDDLIPVVLDQFQTLYPIRITTPEQKRVFRQWLKETNLSPLLPSIRCPTWVLGGGRDTVLPGNHAKRIYQELKAPRRFTYYPEGDHMLMTYFNELQPRCIRFFLSHCTND